MKLPPFNHPQHQHHPPNYLLFGLKTLPVLSFIYLGNVLKFSIELKLYLPACSQPVIITLNPCVWVSYPTWCQYPYQEYELHHLSRRHIPQQSLSAPPRFGLDSDQITFLQEKRIRAFYPAKQLGLPLLVQRN